MLRLARGVPLSWVWLAILFATTRRQLSAGRLGSRRLQREHSTNLRRLRTEPARVLVSSLFWLDDRRWWPYVPAFAAVVAPAERRLGTGRWLLVGSAAHVIGTFVGQGHLRLRIRTGRAPTRLVNARDVGVSYFALGVAGALSGYIPSAWRARTQLAVTGALAANAVARPTATEVGHLTAFTVGLAASTAAPDRESRPFPPDEWPSARTRS